MMDSTGFEVHCTLQVKVSHGRRRRLEERRTTSSRTHQRKGVPLASKESGPAMRSEDTERDCISYKSKLD